MKKMVPIIMTLCIIAALGVSAHADWYNANVQGAGVSGPYTFVVLTDAAATPSFTNRWFILDTANNNANKMLATALTAQSSGIKVQVNFYGTGVPAQYTLVAALLMNQYN